MLKIMLEEGDNTKQRQSEIERLQAYRKQIQHLLDNQRKLKAQADAAPRLAAMLGTIRAAIAQLESLIGKQAKEIEDTSAAAKGGTPAAAGSLGEARKSIRQETQDVGKMLDHPGGPTDSPQTRPEGNPPENPPPAGDQPATRPAPRQKRRSTIRQAQDRPSGTDTQPADEHSQGEAAVQAGVSGSRDDVKQASNQMQAAENELGRKAVPEAVPMQKKSLESLRRALQELKKQEQENAKQLDQAEAAKRQRNLRRAPKTSPTK